MRRGRSIVEKKAREAGKPVDQYLMDLYDECDQSQYRVADVVGVKQPAISWWFKRLHIGRGAKKLDMSA